ncbi:hypothetical protein [Spirulina sp. 06S082]|uniref:hypothetical protein n=1 Tax=Spirulina sp. 06S082 TaxID=3110248 RepID=UPI002B214DEE|nr:hypothetical protein [Spirulina sp. 06S082]MEA5471182.1 hypothetical protein [Spirulina sp. 06S082]
MKNLIIAGYLLTALSPLESSSTILNNISQKISDRPTPTISQISAEEEWNLKLEQGWDLMERESLGEWLKLGLSETEILTQLGTPSEKKEDIFWGAIGMYVQKWEYGDRGIRLQMQSEQPGEPKQVLSIVITEPCELKTNAGIGIGSSKEEVVQAYRHYQDPYSHPESESFVAGTAYGGLIFSFENNRVKEIFIGVAAP